MGQESRLRWSRQDPLHLAETAVVALADTIDAAATAVAGEHGADTSCPLMLCLWPSSACISTPHTWHGCLHL